MNWKYCCAGWMINHCRQGNKYFLQHNSRLVKAVVKQIEYKLDVNTLQQQPVEGR